MSENKRETGVRIPIEDHRPSEINQGAAKNDKPKKGFGLSQSQDETTEKTRQSDQAGTMEGSPQSDAKGANAKTQRGGANDGVVSADPRVQSGKKSGDTTFKHTFDGIDP
jgi:hypothetical protein